MEYSLNSQNSNSVYTILNSNIDNQICADCKNKISSHVNLLYGTFICDKCAKIFQQSNLANGKIKSLDDNFSTYEISYIVGNHAVNSEYEYNLPYGFIRPTPDSQNEMTNFLIDKYINNKYKKQENEPQIDLNAINQFITLLQGLSAVAIVAFVIIMLVLLLIFKIFGLNNIFVTTCLLMVFTIEIYSSKSSFSLLTIFMQFLFGKFGFELKKTLILICFLKLTRLGFSQKTKILNILAFILIVYGFGFQNVIVASEIVVFLIIIEILLICKVGGKIGNKIMNAINGNQEY